MLTIPQLEALIICHVKNTIDADGNSPTLPAVCVMFASMNPDTFCTNEVFSVCLDLERNGHISFLMVADGTITVY